MNGKFSKTLEYLKNDEIEPAIDELILIFEDSPVHKQLILSSASWKRVQRLWRLGIIDWSALEAKNEQIIGYLVDLSFAYNSFLEGKFDDRELAKKIDLIYKALPVSKTKIAAILSFFSAIGLSGGWLLFTLINPLYEEFTALEATGSGTIIQGVFEKLDQGKAKHYYRIGGVCVAKQKQNYGAGSLRALDVMLTEGYDLALSATKFEPQPDFWSDPMYRGKYFLEMAISNDTAVCLVNSQNPIDTIRLAELQRMFFDTLHPLNKWGELSGVLVNNPLHDSIIIGIMSRGEGRGESGIRHLFISKARPGSFDMIRAKIDRQDRRLQKGPKSICKDVAQIIPAMGIVSQGLSNCSFTKRITIVDSVNRPFVIPTRLYIYVEVDTLLPKLETKTLQLMQYLLSEAVQTKIRQTGFAGLDRDCLNFQRKFLNIESTGRVNLKAYLAERRGREGSPVIYRLPEFYFSK